MKHSEQINELAAALCAAQGEMPPAIINRVNPHFKSKYADLGAVWEAARPVLNKHGLAIVQGGFPLTTMLIHKSGQWIADELAMKPDKDTPQGVGSAITYARRYGLGSMLGIITDEDDDGNHASAPPTQRAVTPKPQAASARDQLRVTVKEWSGVKAEDVRDAIYSCAKKAGITVEGQMTDQQAQLTLTWVLANKSTKFTEAVK